MILNYIAEEPCQIQGSSTNALKLPIYSSDGYQKIHSMSLRIYFIIVDSSVSGQHLNTNLFSMRGA